MPSAPQTRWITDRRGTTTNTRSNESAALDACAREPIQHSGAIQPHGCLLSCAIDDLLIRHVDELLGLPLS